MVAKKSTVRGELLCGELLDLKRRLELCRVCATVSVQALEQQNADLDADIAAVLRRCVGDRLFDEVQRIEGWLAQWERAGKGKRKEGRKR